MPDERVAYEKTVRVRSYRARHDGTRCIEAKQRLRDGLPMDPLVLVIDRNDPKRILGLDGLHRAVAAIDLRVRKVPAVVVRVSP